MLGSRSVGDAGRGELKVICMAEMNLCSLFCSLLVGMRVDSHGGAEEGGQQRPGRAEDKV